MFETILVFSNTNIYQYIFFKTFLLQFDIDFSKLHPNKANNLFTKWEHFRKVVMPLLKEAKDPECVELLKEFSACQQTKGEFSVY